MVDVSILARDIVKTIEREDVFFEMKKTGCFRKIKAKDVRSFFNEDWDSN